MGSHAEVYKKFIDLMKSQVPVNIQVGMVKAIDSEEKTCTVTLVSNGLDIPGVRLKAGATKSKEYCVIYPRLKSFVLIGLIGGNETAGEYVVIQVDEFDIIEIKVDKTLVGVTKNAVTLVKDKAQVILSAQDIILKYGETGQESKVTMTNQKITLEPFSTLEIKNSAANLKGALNSLIDAIQALTILYPAMTVNPASLPAFVDARTKINSILS